MSESLEQSAKRAWLEVYALREQVEFWQKEAAGRRDDMANYTRIVSETIDRLNVEVEKLTKDLDALRSRRCEVCGYLEHEREHTGCLREQLAALAEQNEKLRAVLDKLARLGNEPYLGNSIGNRIAAEALQLPDLASPVLNRIRAEGMKEAEKIVRKRVQWVSNGQGIQYRSTAPESISAESLADEIRARAAELEKTNG